MLDKIGTMMQRAGDEGCMDNSCMWTYGIGDVQGEIYLTSGSLTDWTHWAFGAASYTVEVPPRTRELGGFAPSETRVHHHSAPSNDYMVVPAGRGGAVDMHALPFAFAAPRQQQLPPMHSPQ